MENKEQKGNNLYIVTGQVGVFIYIISWGIPVDPNMPLAIIGFSGVLVALSGNYNRFSLKLPLILSISAFLLSHLLSLMISIDIQRSFLLSLSLLPSLLIYFLVIVFFSIQQIKWIYLAFSIAALMICLNLLGVVWYTVENSPDIWISLVGNPLLLVPNDLILLSLIAPLSLTLVYHAPRHFISILAILSILLSIGVITLFQSRGALLILFISIVCVTGLLWTRYLWLLGIAVLVSIIVDLTQGFPLLNKFGNVWDTRLLPWLTAWQMFLDAPLLGQGTHTFGILYDSYQQTITIPDGITVDSRLMPWAHNLYLETLAGQGLVGLVTLGIVLLRTLWMAGKVHKMSQSDKNPFNAGALAAMIGFCIAALFELSFVRHWCVGLLFILIAIITLSSFHNSYPGKLQ